MDRTSQRAFWREESRRFFARNFAGADLARLPPTSYLVELLDAHPLPLAGARILDVGCGAGNNLRWLAQRFGARCAVGVEASPAVVAALAQAFPAHAFVAADAVTLPFADGAFDLVVVRGVLHWVDRGWLLPTVAELLRVCRSHLLVSDYAPRTPYSVAYRHEARHRTFKADPAPLFAATGLVRQLASLRHHADDAWNAAHTILWRKLDLGDAYPLRDEHGLRRAVDPVDVAHATRVLARAGEGEPILGRATGQVLPSEPCPAGEFSPPSTGT